VYAFPVSRVAPAPSSPDRPGVTLEEWYALPEDEPGELVEGQLVEEEMPDYVHGLIVLWLGHLLRAWLGPMGGFVGGSDAKFAVREGRGRKPDLSLFLPGGHVPPRRGLVRVPPDLAIEIVSASPRDGRRDRVEKVADYAAFGVKWYWIVDPELRTLEILELGGDGLYRHALGRSEGRIESVPGCPGLTIDLDALWAEVDRLGPEESP